MVGWYKAFVSELPARNEPGDMGCHVSPGAVPQEVVCPWLTSKFSINIISLHWSLAPILSF